MVEWSPATATALVEERKAFELSFQNVTRAEKQTKREILELEASSKEIDESLQQLQTRLASVTAELSHLKLSTRLSREVEFDPAPDVDSDQSVELLSYRDVSGAIATAFKHAVKTKLNEPAFIEQLGDQNVGSRPEFCHVVWESESADWKVHDPCDNTEVTFGALLEDVCRYWGLDHEAMALVDRSGATWPLEGFVWDETSTTDGPTVWLARLPHIKALGPLAVEYVQDEAELPIAVQRRLNRERRAAQINRQTKESIRKQKQRDRNALIWEMVKYVLMMALYFFVLQSRRNVLSAHLFLDGLVEGFIGENYGDFNEKTYLDLSTYDEFYEWAQGPFTETLLPRENYDGNEIPPDRQRVMTFNRIVGGLRLRQARVTPNAGCTIAVNVQDEFNPSRGPDAGTTRKRKYVDKCYSGYYAGATWSRRPYGPLAQPMSNDTGPPECRHLFGQDFGDASQDDYDSYNICLGTAFWPRANLIDPSTGLRYTQGAANLTDPLLLAFSWQTGLENGLPTYTRDMKYSTYDGSGFVFDLVNLTTDNLVTSFNFLREETWLDRQTRALFMSLVVFNANYNLYAVLNFELELSRAGVFVPNYNLQTAKLDLYFGMLDSFGDTLFVVVEGVLYIGMCFYLINEFQEVINIYNETGSVRGYFTDFWNIIDWSLIVLSFVALGMRINFVLMAEVRNFSPFSNKFEEISAAVDLYNQSFSLDAIAASFGIFKILRFFDLQTNLLILRQSVSRGVDDLSVFTVILMTMILGFALAGMNIFGQEADEYIDPLEAFNTLFLMVLGEFDFDKLRLIDAVFAYIFFLVYQIFVFLIMVNIFLAILNDAYIAIKEKFDAEEKDVGPPPLTIRQRIQRARAWLRQRELDRRIEALRRDQRRRDMIEKREARKVEEARLKTMKALRMARIEV